MGNKITIRLSQLILLFLILTGFYYRIKGLSSNYSFWTDEEHVAIFTRAILERGRPVLESGYSTGYFQFLQYWVSAISAKIFGLNEFALRFPSVIFGVLTIVAVYLVGRKLFNEKVGLIAAFFTTFLRIEILWSTQARPYQALQFFFLLGALLLIKLFKENKNKIINILSLAIIGLISSLFHGLGAIFFIDVLLCILIVKKDLISKKVLLGLIILLVIFSTINWIYIINILDGLGKINNLSFYRVFLWFNYSIFILLAIIGAITQIIKQKKEFLIPVIFLVIQVTIASFLLNQPFTRYLYIVFPFLIILASYGLWIVFDNLQEGKTFFLKNLKIFAPFLLTFFIVAMGWKFSLVPKNYYPLNEDMQEIPQVDWKSVYGVAKEKLDNNPGAIFVSNWTDLSVWFFGEGKINYLVRTSVVDDPMTGLTKDKVINRVDLFDKMVKNNKKGVLVIDSWDNFVPDGIRDYVKLNLKKEYENDRLYPIQPRYWPVEVYSWGI